jgi:hypothetical protein
LLVGLVAPLGGAQNLRASQPASGQPTDGTRGIGSSVSRSSFGVAGWKEGEEDLHMYRPGNGKMAYDLLQYMSVSMTRGPFGRGTVGNSAESGILPWSTSSTLWDSMPQ